MDENIKGISSYFEKKKTEKNLLISKQKDMSESNQSFNPESEFQQTKQIGISGDFGEKSVVNESKRTPHLDESKSIKDFFTSNINKTTHSKDKKKPPSANYRKGSPGKPHQFSKLNDREKEEKFLDVYDENLNLKKKEEKLNNKIKKLNTKLQTIEKEFISIKKVKDPQEGKQGVVEKEKLNAMVELKNENQILKEKLKALSQAKSIVKSKPSGKTKKIYSSLAPKDGNLEEALKIIEILKKRLKDSDTQLKQTQEAIQKSGLGAGHFTSQSDIHNKNIKLAALQNRYDELLATMESQKISLEQTKSRLQGLNEEIYKEREEKNNLQKQLRATELQVSHVKDVEAKVKELEDEKKNLNLRLKDLCESPFIKQHEERANLQFQIRKQESDLQKLELENKSLKELLLKSDHELERTKKSFEETSQELKQKIELSAQLAAKLEMKDKQLGPFKDFDRDDDVFLKTLGMLKWQGEAPSWSKLEFLDRPQALDVRDPESLLKEIERLRIEKGELAAQLEKSQTLLKIQMESEQEQSKIYQAQIATLELQLKGAVLRASELSKIVDLKGFGSKEGVEVYEKGGVKYDDRISVFSDDTSEIDIEPGTNYFEVWLGDTELDENSIKSIMKSNKNFQMDSKHILTFLIIDFYDHDSQHSSIAEGVHTNFNFQMSFRVICDEVFMNYLETGYLRLELFVSEGMETFSVAKANISLKDLVKKTLGEGVAPALSSTVSFIGEKNQIVGLLNYRMRMKFPIGESLKWMKEKRELGIIEEEVAQLDENIKRRRKLVIIIDKAAGLSPRYSTFVVYSIDGKDYHTTPQPGQNPRWDYTGIHEIDYDENFVSYLKTNVLEFVLLDDNVPLVSGGAASNEINDLIGFARLSINGLINNEIIDSTLPVHGAKNEKRGNLHIKIFWHEGAMPKKPMPEDSLISKSWEHELILRIAAAIRSKQLTIESAFMIFDQDRDQVVNLFDFQATLLGTLNMHIHKEEVELLYQKLPSPLTKDNFISVFGLHVPQGSSISGQPKSEISRLNVMLQNNTMQLSSAELMMENTKKIIGQKFAERIHQTSQLNLFKELDVNQDGYISLLELKVYFLGLGLKFSDEELYSFIKAVDLDHDNKINIKEFLGYVLSGFTLSSERNMEPGSSERMRGGEYYDDFNSVGSHLSSPKRKLDNVIGRMMENILNYMKNNKLTFLKLYEKIDRNSDNFLSKSELNDFLKKIGLNVSSSETKALLDYFDENKDNKISIKEFVDHVKEFSANRNLYSLYDDEYNKVPLETLNEKILEFISQYLVANKLSIPDFFNSIDRNNDGIISRDELNLLFIKQLKLTLSRDEESTFFNYLDKNRDNKIQISEFVAIMKPGLERTMAIGPKSMNSSHMSSRFSRNELGTTPISNEFLANVHNKLIEYVGKNSDRLKNNFQIQESENQGFVSQEDFKQVMKEIRFKDDSNLSFKEINAIIQSLCEKNANGDINYEKFVVNIKNRPKKLTNFSLPNEGSSRSLLKSQKLAKEVFGKIAKVVKDNKIDLKDAFRTFDYDKDGTIDVEELKKAFDQMKLNYTTDDVEEIINYVGENGKVNYEKFMEALKLK